MTVNELLTILTRISFVLLGALTLNDLIRRRDRIHLLIALTFNSLALVLVIPPLLRVTGDPVAWSGRLTALLLISQPYLLLRVVECFRPVSTMMLRGALAGLILSWVLVIVAAGQPLAAPATLALVAYFALVNGYSASAFIRGAITSRGVVQQRLRFAGIGSGLLALALILLGLAALARPLATVMNSLVQLTAILAAWSFYLGFVPPRWLHTTWQLAELRRFLLHSANKRSLEDRAQMLERLYQTAVEAVGGIAAVAALWDESRSRLTLQPSGHGLSGDLSAADGVLGRAVAECRPVFADRSMPLGEAERRLMDQAGAGALLVVPIEAAGNDWGRLLVFLQQRSLFVEDDLSLLALFAEQTAIVFENSALLAGQKVLLEKLGDHARELEAANKELESFSYSVSHDLRAPLRAVDGFSRILLEDYAAQLPAEAARYLQLVRNNAQQMGELIEGLLTFSRLGRQPLKKQTVAAGDLVRQALAELRPHQTDRSVEIVVGDLPPCEADPLLLRQVFVNLLSNALKFTRNCEHARIEVGWQDSGGAGVYFVRDNGAGFDMKYAHKLFGVFQRLHRSDDYEGTGVGLANVQRVLHRHGGRIWVEAAVDQGATFYFTVGGQGAEPATSAVPDTPPESSASR